MLFCKYIFGEIDKERFPKEFQEEFAEKLASKDFDHKDRFKPNLINDYDICF